MFINARKTVSYLLAFVMTFSLVSVPAFGEEAELTEGVAFTEDTYLPVKEELNDGTVSDIYEDEDNSGLKAQFDEAVTLYTESEGSVVLPEGDGTEESPYMIYTEEELISFAVGNIPGGLDSCWELHSDIELTADTWAPIGAYDAFTGYFDGKGHTISSSKLFQSTAMSGIFGQNRGVIKNLNVDVTIEEVATNTGALCAANYGTIENCHATGSITTSENKNIGGLVGLNENGTILNSSSSVIISAPNSTVGGLVGYNKNAVIKYSRTYNKTIENEEEELVCGNNVGGLVGYAYNDDSNIKSLISNCYTLGKVKGGSNAGGLVGCCDVLYENRGYITIEYCYAKGVITNGSTKGGLVGNLDTTSRVGIRYCYFNSINNYDKYGFGVSLSDIADRETFYDWNFDDIWAIDSEINNGYPYIDLRGEEEIYIDGEGTEENPYVITDEKQLCYLASEKLPLDACYVLGNDITVTANYWTPIAAMSDSYFTGVFDGNGYSITGVHTEKIYYNSIGLFGRSSGTIKNLTVESWFAGNNYAGGLVAYNSGTIDNCSTYIDNPEYSITGNGFVGGLCGHSEGMVINSHSSANVNAPSAKAGGLIGDLANGKVKYSYATGNVIGTHAGGLVGFVYNDVSNRTTTIITNCYAMGKITGSTNGGGLIGYCEVLYENRGYITVEYCYARGLVVEQGSTGGLMGNFNTADRVVVRYCYYNIANTGNAVGFGVKAASLKTPETLYGWDFDNIWAIEKEINSGYPHLDIRGETPVNILQGNGEEDRPYLIYTEEDLRSLVADVYGPYDLSVKHFYKLMNDIEVTANFWTPIGANGVNVFNGIFDGNGYTISGIKLSHSHYARSGLFGVSSGTIKNLTVEAEINGKIIGAICGENSGTIENCNSLGTLINSSSNTERYSGGLTGINFGTITKSRSSATVECAGWEAGGLAGRSANGKITYCYTDGAVSGRYAGGLVGRIYNDNNDITSTVKYCYTRGSVTATEYGGGLAGFCDLLYEGRGYISIEYSYSTVVPEGSGSLGGLIGAHDTIERNFIRHSYYNDANTGNRCGFSASAEQMTDRNLYYMWDFDNVWEMDSSVNDGYPYLNVRGTTKPHYLDGYGDEDDPYMIETEEDLWALVIGTYDLTGKYYYQLQNDIELTAPYWTPIGGNYSQKVFNGIFDGNGYTISGVRLYNSELPDSGLFGNSSGVIKNLKVEGNLDGNKFTGLICAYNSGIIDNCSSAGTVSVYNTQADVLTGGISGINCGTISNSHSLATVSGINGDTGGIAGRNYNSLIYQCYASGDVSGKYAGGLVGRQYNDNNDTTATIRNCYATGNVSAGENGGGLVGICDLLYEGRGYTAIDNSYSTGTVTGNTIGGLVGYSDNSVRNSILSSYYNSTSTGLGDIDRGTPLEESAMKLKSSYVGWDFEGTWAIDQNTNNGYPYLLGQELEIISPVEGIIIEPREAEISVGEGLYIKAAITPVNATNKEIIWSSSNEAVATVSDGKVTGMSEGTAIITAMTADGGFMAQCTVNVTKAAEPAVICGDANGDGEVDFADAIFVLKHDAGVSPLTGDNLKAADTNGDGEADFADAILILKYDSGLISSFK